MYLLAMIDVAVIDTKGRETEYAGLRDDCNKTVEDINGALIKLQALQGPSLAASTATPY